MKERKNISFHGLLDLNVLISKNNKIQRNPIINIRGLPFDELEKNEIIYELEDKFFDVCSNINLNNKKSEKLLIDELKSQLRKVIFNRCNKKPFMNINFIKI